MKIYFASWPMKKDIRAALEIKRKGKSYEN